MHKTAEIVEEEEISLCPIHYPPNSPKPSSLMALAPQTQTKTFNCNHNSDKNGREVAEVVVEEEEEIGKGTPIRYVPLCDLYSATSPCVSGSSNVLMSKKVKARKLLPIDRNHSHNHTHPPSSSDLKRRPPPPPPPPPPALSSPKKPPITRFYSRHFPKRPRNSSHSQKPSFFDSLVSQSHSQSVSSPALALVKEEQRDGLEDFHDVDDAERLVQKKKRKKRKFGNNELIRLGVDSSTLLQLEGSRLRESRSHNYNLNNSNRRKRRPSENWQIPQMVNSASQRWVRLSFVGADSKKFIGLQCKVYWPLDADWYIGHVVGYNAETNRHHIAYEDGDEEDIILCNERIKFYVSCDEIQKLNLSCSTKTSDADGLDCNEMVVLAASFDDCHDLGSGDIIWAKLTGHAMWPAVVVDESLLKNRKGLNRNLAGKSIPVQFFGTHDFARVNPKHVISFLRGLLSSFHLKCKKQEFVQSLEEAKWYLSEQKLPKRMLRMQNSVEVDDCDSGSQEDESSELNSKLPAKPSLSNLAVQRLQDLPIGYRPVRVKWKDLDKCSVCHMDEEYENNLFLQCDKCRMMVHAKCYGELEPVDGVLWLCNLCRPGAPDFPPPCCLCPVTGGAMKPTTDGRWAHLACAIWIPETCLSDVKKMEPIDGLSRINKDRWKLLCSICGVSYGACIQCSNNTCRVAYHPLCARAAGFCVELEDEDRLHLISMDEDEDENEQCIRLVSFCKRHRPLSSARLIADDRNVPIARQCSDYSPPSNPSGCARSEPYNYFGRRGRKEPEALAAASSKRLFVENRPYLVSGYCQHKALGNTPSSTALAGSKFSFSLEKLKISQLDALESIFSMADKYKYMKETFRRRLAFGKSGIHGFGIFAKQPHRAGDMVIEYTGELVRPPVADRREHLIYNSLVGAGTYMFRIDDEHVIDATRAGSIAHLINHSCEPNCYSRVISVNGDEHIIIFAKRDIKQWEELTYDYRFFSIDEQLACYCGFSRCRGVVNDIEAEEQVAKLNVPRSELIDWSRE